MHLSSPFVLAWIAAVAAFPEKLQRPFQLSNGGPVLNSRLDDAILNILNEFKTPGGVGVAVVRKTAEGTWQLESKGYGNASVAGNKVTADTLFCIGSNSKLFDVLATGLLISNETLAPRISWSSKIASILPQWKLMDPVASSESTIIDLMSHRTGLPSHDFMGPLDDSVETVISRLRYLRPSTGFREQFQYSNLMYIALSHIPPTLLNTTFENYVHDNIITPLGMNSTTHFYADAAKMGTLAGSFLREDANVTEDPFAQGIIRALPYWDQSEKGHMASGAGGVISSAHDMAIWLQMLLMEGKNRSNKTVIPPEVIRKVATGLIICVPVAAYPELSPLLYGGGQMRGTYRGFEMIEHGGSTPGFRTQVTRFPSENLGIAVLSNDEDLGTGIMESVKYRIVDEVLQLEAIDWPARYRAKYAKAVPPPTIPRDKNADPPSVPYTALAGSYTHPAYGTLELCLFSADAAVNGSCTEIASQLPGVIDPGVPTLVAKWDTLATNYIQLSHYSGNKFNVTPLQSYVRMSPPWVWKMPRMEAEFEMDGGDVGFAISGIWGEGAGVAPPEGKTVQERAEVWFAKS